MQHNGAGETPNGEPPPLSFSAEGPLQMATSRMRRYAQEGRTVPQPRVMVVFSAASDTEKQGNAMSAADFMEEEYRKPAIPVPNLNLGKSLDTLDAPEEFPEVIPLNVGGTYFTTRLSTLRRYEDTMLAAMFSGRHQIPRDAEGRYFIDRDGAYFGSVYRLVNI
ncbi:BTB/POZ domain-containing protein KCTD7-like [Xyrauchen texanus]|uniref:BTB/POZ domain-containing protein KCTD7-like n=1 Tax=Xyrauchen texanus TaxID=154827 RepID=UPI002242395C|nr:BTB/POZ domain-containing protein KCTD7-like [Xyrauchen texanus]